jgi:hypothetical protein
MISYVVVAIRDTLARELLAFFTVPPPLEPFR